METTSTIIITAALIFYSIGVWAERFSGRLKWGHFIFFVLGLICDTWGTGLMVEMAGGLSVEFHVVTGVIAILLMFIHALWALIVLIKKDERAVVNFHKFSISVWVIWLIPYLSPMFIRMAE